MTRFGCMGLALGFFLAALIVPVTLGQRQPVSVQRGSVWNDPRLRERFYNRAVERYMDGLAQAYELTEEQRTLVSWRLNAIKDDQEAYTAKVQDELGRLREDMSEYWRKQEAGESVNAEQMQQVSRRLGEIWQASPLLNPQNVIRDIEKLLPPEQAGKGRTNWEAARMERIREWTDRYAAYRAGGVRLGGDEGDAWQAFVDKFCTEFGLDANQRASAYSVLRDVQTRRDAYRKGHADEIEAAQQIEDFRYRREQTERVMQPISDLYDELRARLDKIPTSSQIDAFRQRAATQPADGAEGRPSVGVLDPSAATRPSEMIRQPGSPVRDRGIGRSR